MKMTSELVTTWPRFWDLRPNAIDPQALRTWLHTVAQRDRHMQIVLANVRAVKGVHAARRMVRRYLLCASAKLAAVSRAWQSVHGSIKEIADPALLKLVEFAEDLFAWKPAPGQALARPKLKRDSENYRLIHELALSQKAQDKMAASAARAVADLLPTQFNQSGKGTVKFDAWLTERMPKIQTVVTVDIPSCFDVIRRGSVEVSLLLPKRVVEAAMLKPMDRAKRLPGVLTGIGTTNTHDVGTSAAKRGVPQGSALAQLASDIEIDKVLRAVGAAHGSVHVAAFSDNLIFLLEDAGWLGSVQAALTEATTKQFGSDVTTALVNRIRCDKPNHFQFCRRTYSWKKGKLHKGVPPGYLDDYAIKTAIRMQDAYAAKDLNGLERCEASVVSFFHSHLAIDGVFEECASLFVEVHERRKTLMKLTVKTGSGSSDITLHDP